MKKHIDRTTKAYIMTKEYVYKENSYRIVNPQFYEVHYDNNTKFWRLTYTLDYDIENKFFADNNVMTCDFTIADLKDQSTRFKTPIEDLIMLDAESKATYWIEQYEMSKHIYEQDDIEAVVEKAFRRDQFEQLKNIKKIVAERLKQQN